MDLIHRTDAINAANDSANYWDGGPNKCREETIRDGISAIPSVPAVPLDKLCEWMALNSINIPCTSCANFVNEYCTAIGDTSKPCPNSADEWRRAITEWMEEQKCTSTDTEH